MELDYSVMAVSARWERPFYYSDSLADACRVAMSKNRSPYNILYIVQKPCGRRLSINQQSEVLRNNG